MSHIPSSRMPHARAHDDQIDGQAAQPGQAQPAPEPTTTVPPASASGASANATGSTPDDAATEPASTTAVTNGPNARDEDDASPLAIAAMVIGGLAIFGGLVAALLPLLAPKDEPKSRKRKRRKFV